MKVDIVDETTFPTNSFEPELSFLPLGVKYDRVTHLVHRNTFNNTILCWLILSLNVNLSCSHWSERFNWLELYCFSSLHFHFLLPPPQTYGPFACAVTNKMNTCTLPTWNTNQSNLSWTELWIINADNNNSNNYKNNTLSFTQGRFAECMISFSTPCYTFIQSHSHRRCPVQAQPIGHWAPSLGQYRFSALPNGTPTVDA